MPIHSDGYRSYSGKGRPHDQAWLVIMVTGIRGLMSNRRLWGLLLLAWVPFVIRTAQMYAAANLPQAPFLQISAMTFHDFLQQQSPFVFFVTVWVGSGLIANDLRSNALQIYLSRPLTRVQYVAGKLGIVGCLLLLVTWIPAMLLLVVQVLLAGNLRFLTTNFYLVPAITIASGVLVAVSSLSILALSSLSNSSRFVAITYAGLIFFSEALFNVVRVTTRSTAMSWLSPAATVGRITDAIFMLPTNVEPSLTGPIAAIIVLLAVSLLVLERRVRAVEVVA